MERLDKKADTLRLDNIETRVRSAEQVHPQTHTTNPLSLPPSEAASKGATRPLLFLVSRQGRLA
jgi:hypothetical protein